jgi:hypothetical protein
VVILITAVFSFFVFLYLNYVVRFWDSKTGDLIFEGKVHSGQITSVSLAPGLLNLDLLFII